MQQSPYQTFDGVTLAILFGEKVAVTSPTQTASGPAWSLPTQARDGSESPADCAVRLLEDTLGLAIPITRLNWPIVSERHDAPANWFFAAWITPTEWDLLARTGGPQGTVMLSISAFLSASSVPEVQKETLRRYLDQPKPVLGLA
jgi:hypothetical protein